jgi:hypothetical protein
LIWRLLFKSTFSLLHWLCLLFSRLFQLLTLLSDRVVDLALNKSASLFEGLAAEDIEQIDIVNVFPLAIVIEVLVFEQIEILVELRSSNELNFDVPILLLWCDN